MYLIKHRRGYLTLSVFTFAHVLRRFIAMKAFVHPPTAKWGPTVRCPWHSCLTRRTLPGALAFGSATEISQVDPQCLARTPGFSTHSTFGTFITMGRWGWKTAPDLRHAGKLK